MKHRIEVDVAVLTAHPATGHKRRREAHKPAVGIVVRRSGLAAHVGFHTQTAHTASGTFVDNGTQHDQHLVSAGYADDFLHFGSKGCQHVSVVVLDAGHEQRSYPDTLVGESGIGTYHLADGNLARAQTE